MDPGMETEGSGVGSGFGVSPIRGPRKGPSIATLRGARYRYEGKGWGRRGSIESGLSGVAGASASGGGKGAVEDEMGSRAEDIERSETLNLEGR